MLQGPPQEKLQRHLGCGFKSNRNERNKKRRKYSKRTELSCEESSLIQHECFHALSVITKQLFFACLPVS